MVRIPFVVARMAPACVFSEDIIFWYTATCCSSVSCCSIVSMISLAQDLWVAEIDAMFSTNSSSDAWLSLKLVPNGIGARMGKAQMATSRGASSNAVPARNSSGIAISGRISSGISSMFWTLYADPMIEPSILMKAGSLFSSLRFPRMAAKEPTGPITGTGL